MIGEEEVASSDARGSLDWILAKISSLKGLSGTATGLEQMAMESPPLEILKSHVDVVLRDMV